MKYHLGNGELRKNLTINMGNCNHRKYVLDLVEMVRSNVIDPQFILTQVNEMSTALDAFKSFDGRQNGWIKVELVPCL